MTPKKRRNLSGTFLVADMGQGAWRLSQHGGTRQAPASIEVILRGVEARAADALRHAEVHGVELEWHSDTVSVTIAAGGTVEVQAAVVHEPLPHLYGALPLAGLDAQARRFWRWVFLLVRIPGGRRLLGIWARRTPGGD